jgi:hypothetical protein
MLDYGLRHGSVPSPNVYGAGTDAHGLDFCFFDQFRIHQPQFFDYPGKAAQAPGGVVMRDQNGRLVVHEVSGEQPEFLLELPA